MLLSDHIARLINEMLEEGSGQAEVRRNDLAARLGCAPSQINYVITSRFTPERGYVTESRRGGGGYIRIVRVQMTKNEYLMHFFQAVGKVLSEQEARVYLSVRNDSGYQASIYTYDAKAIQDGKQFEHEDNYEAGDSSDIGDVLDGASKEGILRFKGLDPEKPVKIQIGAYSDNFDIEMEDYVFEVE